MGSQTTLSVQTGGIFAVWWDKKFSHTNDADFIISILQEARNECLTNLGLQDPPNGERGFYYNVYIHHYGEDLFPEHWWLGQGVDSYGLPFLGVAQDTINRLSILHESFHIFQFSSNSPG